MNNLFAFPQVREHFTLKCLFRCISSNHNKLTLSKTLHKKQTYIVPCLSVLL